MGEVYTGFNQGSHVLNLDDFAETAIIVALEFAETHCEGGQIVEIDLPALF
jgi:hypothetical protein